MGAHFWFVFFVFPSLQSFTCDTAERTQKKSPVQDRASGRERLSRPFVFQKPEGGYGCLRFQLCRISSRGRFTMKWCISYSVRFTEMMTLFQCITAYEQALTCVRIINLNTGMFVYKQLVKSRSKITGYLSHTSKRNRFQSSRGR